MGIDFVRATWQYVLLRWSDVDARVARESFVRVRVIRDRPLQGLWLGSKRGPLQLSGEDAPAFDPRDALGCTRGTIVSQVTVAPGELIHAQPEPLPQALHTRQWDTSFRWILCPRSSFRSRLPRSSKIEGEFSASCNAREAVGTGVIRRSIFKSKLISLDLNFISAKLKVANDKRRGFSLYNCGVCCRW